MEKNRYIRFDWAAKNILRNKADYVIFEGLISVLVKDKIKIVELLESESNKEARDDKYNRVDIKAKNSKGEIILVEIQQTRELDYLQRMLYGVAKTITEHIGEGQPYEQIKKVFSINILYFKLGEGTDYLYHGQTVLKGVHDEDTLRLTEHEREDLKVVSPENIFPEYYVIRVNEFNKLAVNHLEEWIQYLKDEYIKPDTKAPGLKEARKRLEYLRMSPEKKREYDHYLDTLVRDTDVLKTQLLEARIEGLKQGREEGREEGLKQGHEEGLRQGHEEGHRQGHEEGRRQGHEEGLRQGHEEGLRQGHEEGHKEGLRQGHEEGRKEERLANARNLKNNGVPMEVIIKSLGLTPEEIELC